MTHPALHDLPPLLLPVPSRMERAPGFVTLRDDAVAWIHSREPRTTHKTRLTPLPAQVACRVTGGWCGAGSIDAQSYRLRIGTPDAPGDVCIESPGESGLRHARATLRQLLTQYGSTLPALDIHDTPAFATRGVMLDVSRCRIPTMQEFARIVDTLSDLKCNHLQLYTEHTFAYEGHDAVWRDWSPITPGEARTLDTMCKARGIDLAPNQNCFGHLAQWLNLPRYAHLAETHGEWLFDVWPRKGPFSLCPTDPRSEAFVRDLLGQLLPCFSSGLVNIGCDETYDIAYGRSRDDVARRGRARVYLDFVERICTIARELDKKPMFWGDIALSHPEHAKHIPHDAIALAWNYEPDAPFEEWCRVLRDAGHECWVCPGTSSWCSVTGRTSERLANIERAAHVGRSGGATGMLTCDWGDLGHWQQWPVALRGIADGLGAAWNGASLPDARAISLHALHDSTLSLAGTLDAIGDADLELREHCLALSRPGTNGRLRNQSALFADMRVPWTDRTDIGDTRSWLRVRERLSSLESAWSHVHDALVREECTHTLALSMALCARALARRGLGGLTAKHAAALMRSCRENHARLWNARSRAGGLTQSLEYFDRVIRELETAP